MNEKYPMQCVYASPPRMERICPLGNFSVTLENGDAIALMKPSISIGRNSACDIVIDDPTVSRRHALLYNVGGQWFLCDAGSQNGTRVNDRRIASGVPCELSDGDVIFLGRQVSLLFGVQTYGSGQNTSYPFINAEPIRESTEYNDEQPFMSIVYASPMGMHGMISDDTGRKQSESFFSKLFKRKR